MIKERVQGGISMLISIFADTYPGNVTGAARPPKTSITLLS